MAICTTLFTTSSAGTSSESNDANVEGGGHQGRRPSPARHVPRGARAVAVHTGVGRVGDETLSEDEREAAHLYAAAFVAGAATAAVAAVLNRPDPGRAEAVRAEDAGAGGRGVTPPVGDGCNRQGDVRATSYYSFQNHKSRRFAE